MRTAAARPWDSLPGALVVSLGFLLCAGSAPAICPQSQLLVQHDESFEWGYS